MTKPHTAAADWNVAVQQALAEGQGVWTLGIISDDNFDAVQHSARAGDPEAARLLDVLPALIETMEALTEPTPAAPVCLTCGTSFWHKHYPHAAVVLYAARDDPGKLLVSGVCSRCWTARRTRAAPTRRSWPACVSTTAWTTCAFCSPSLPQDALELPPSQARFHARRTLIANLTVRPIFPAKYSCARAARTLKVMENVQT